MLWTFLFISFAEDIQLFLLAIYGEKKLLDPSVYFQPQKIIPVVQNSSTPSSSVRHPNTIYPYQNFRLSVLLFLICFNCGGFRVLSHSGFNTFFWYLMILTTFHLLISHFNILFCKVFCPFLKKWLFTFTHWFVEITYTFSAIL